MLSPLPYEWLQLDLNCYFVGFGKPTLVKTPHSHSKPIVTLSLMKPTIKLLDKPTRLTKVSLASNCYQMVTWYLSKFCFPNRYYLGGTIIMSSGQKSSQQEEASLSSPNIMQHYPFLRSTHIPNIKLIGVFGKCHFGVFDRNSAWGDECQLPNRCGTFEIFHSNLVWENECQLPIKAFWVVGTKIVEPNERVLENLVISITTKLKEWTISQVGIPRVIVSKKVIVATSVVWIVSV
ncbi:hypothetical protein CsatA_022262 [Cannabis sativa]